MIYINSDISKKMNEWKKSEINVVIDFDCTITSSNSTSSWAILENSNLVDDKYKKITQELYQKYHPIEFDFNMDNAIKDQYMHQWWRENIELFVAYGLKESEINNVVSGTNQMAFRTGAKAFLKQMHQDNIPVMIISAGIGNFIEQFLKIQGCFYDTLSIQSNSIVFENGVAIGMTEPIIHSNNKNIMQSNLENLSEIKNKRFILLGDHLADIQMVPESLRENTLRISFLDYNIIDNLKGYCDAYDIVCTSNTSFTELMDVLNENGFLVV